MERITFYEFCQMQKVDSEWLQSSDGKLEIDADTCPLPYDRLIVGGSLTISSQRGCILPPYMRVGAELTLRGKGITNLPNRLSVGMCLWLRDTNVHVIPETCSLFAAAIFQTPITQFPKPWTLKGGLYLHECPITELPPGLNVRSLCVSQCPLTKLPDRLTTPYLSIRDTQIREIPKDIHVDEVYVEDSPLEVLPDKWNVRNLVLKGTLLKSLPKRLRVGGFLDISNTPIREIPADCVAGTLIAGSPELKKLPDNWRVEKCVFLRGCPSLTYLPKNLTIGEELHISGPGVKEIPASLRVESLHVANGSIEKLPDNWSLPGSLVLENCPQLKRLPKGLSIGKDLSISNSPVTEIPADCQIRQSLNIQRCPIKNLPANLSIGGQLLADDSALECLPDGLQVGGDVSLARTKVSHVPEDAVIAGVLNIQDCSIQHIPSSVILLGVLSDHPIHNEAYVFQKDGVDFHPNGSYMCVHGLLCRIVERKDNTYHCARMGTNEELYVIVDERATAMGQTLSLAKADLRYHTFEGNVSALETRGVYDQLSFEEAYLCYRLVTWVDTFDMDFLLDESGREKECYTLQELMDLSKGHKGHLDFLRHFQMT